MIDLTDLEPADAQDAHDVCIVVNGTRITKWETYELTLDMQRFDDHFTVTMPFDLDVWRLLRKDAPVKLFIDDSQYIDGYLDTKVLPEDEEVIQITARDRMGRVVQDAAPGIRFSGMLTNDLIKALVSPWFTDITNSNANNRRVLRGRGLKAKAGSEPLHLYAQKKLGNIIEPGQTRGAALQLLLRQLGLIAFSQGDGKSLFVGKPNYDQEPQFRFFMPKAGSARIDEATVRAMGVHESTADRYSEVICVGSGTGTDENYGPRTASRYGVAKDNPATPDGTGLDFTAPKRLVVTRQVASAAEAKELATREKAQRDAAGDRITVRAAGHGQKSRSSSFVTMFVPDTLAIVEDERTETKGIYILTKCVLRGNRKGGEETSIELLRKGSELVSA